MTAVKIPYEQLSPEALHGVIEEFVTRDGTDYGEVEITLETKIDQVLAQIKSGKALATYRSSRGYFFDGGRIIAFVSKKSLSCFQ